MLAQKLREGGDLHFLNLIILAYMLVWIFGGMILLRDARHQSRVVRMMALFAVIIGPFGMIGYLGFRYLGQTMQTHLMLTRDRTHLRDLP